MQLTSGGVSGAGIVLMTSRLVHFVWPSRSPKANGGSANTRVLKPLSHDSNVPASGVGKSVVLDDRLLGSEAERDPGWRVTARVASAVPIVWWLLTLVEPSDALAGIWLVLGLGTLVTVPLSAPLFWRAFASRGPM
jgi:hypothetical protein